MVALYVGGNKVGTVSDLEKLLPGFVAARAEVELRDDAGTTLARIVPPEPLCPWNPSLTRQDLDRMHAQGGGISLAEFWKRMGVE